MTAGRLKSIARMAASASPARLRNLYFEIYGAEASPTIPVERLRASLREAAEELLVKKGAQS